MGTKNIIKTTLLSLSLTAPAFADDLASKMNLPEWSENMSVSVGMINDSLDFE